LAQESGNIKRYKRLNTKFLREANEQLEKGDVVQASEKYWRRHRNSQSLRFSEWDQGKNAQRLLAGCDKSQQGTPITEPAERFQSSWLSAFEFLRI